MARLPYCHQREAVTFPVQVSDYTEDQWRLWINVDGDRDAGLSLQDMTSAQRRRALSILKAGMSARGLDNADKVRHLNLRTPTTRSCRTRASRPPP
jgi:hypothetical protein